MDHTRGRGVLKHEHVNKFLLFYKI
jgi:hypothetical protein